MAASISAPAAASSVGMGTAISIPLPRPNARVVSAKHRDFNTIFFLNFVIDAEMYVFAMSFLIVHGFNHAVDVQLFFFFFFFGGGGERLIFKRS